MLLSIHLSSVMVLELDKSFTINLDLDSVVHMKFIKSQKQVNSDFCVNLSNICNNTPSTESIKDLNPLRAQKQAVE